MISLTRRPRGRALAVWHDRPACGLGSALVLTAALYAAYNLSPFDFNTSRDFVAERIGRLARVPFHGYYENQEFKALADFLTKLGMALPFGVLFHLRFRPDRSAYRRSLTAGWFLLTGCYFLAVEFGQVLLPSRFPESSDVLIATAGVGLGMVLASRFAGSHGAQPRRPAPVGTSTE